MGGGEAITIALPEGATWWDVAVGGIPLVAFLIGASVAWHFLGLAGVGLAVALLAAFLAVVHVLGDPDRVREARAGDEGGGADGSGSGPG